MVDHHEDDTKPSRKRKKTNSRNPLANARGKQQSHENIWFRRTGAGFHLFVQYYAGQPSGTVADLMTVSADHNDVPPPTKPTGGGLSRAAKRRKKKKLKSSGNEPVVDTAPQEETNPNPAAPTSVDPSHPLFQAMKKTAESNPKALALKPFLESMSQPLPVTFRMRRSAPSKQVEELQSKIQTQFPNVVQPLPFGNNFLFQANCSKPELKRYPNLKQFLVDNSQKGTVARQELGSMLPLLALEQAGCFALSKKCRILDLCASPGSKTLQALELLTNSKSRILANDVSESRLQALRDAIQRSGMDDLDRIGYSCQDARHLSTTSGKAWDALICDVPCSGDGTVRKEAHILELWKPEQGQLLHTTQLQILLRALQLVKVGGTVCYSTCSLNPVENEAVVAAALQQYNQKEDDNDKSTTPAIELLEFPTIPGFQRRPGVSTWRVADYRDTSSAKDDDDDDDDETPQLQWYDSHQDACQAKMGHAVKTFWPPVEDEDIPLERCTRLWPQDHDSGGFFLALLRKNH